MPLKCSRIFSKTTDEHFKYFKSSRNVQKHFLSCWTRIYPDFANSVGPDQLASDEANWSGSARFAIKYVNLHQQFGSSSLIGWKLDMGVAS